MSSTGVPLHARLTEPRKPLNGSTSRLYVAVCAAETLTGVELPFAAASEKSVPVPVRVTVWGLLAAPSLMTKFPARAIAKQSRHDHEIHDGDPLISRTLQSRQLCLVVFFK
jgi:hypothetical protein